MSKNPAFKTYIAMGLLLAIWVALFAHYGSKLLYHPGEIEEAAYPLIVVEEAATEERAPEEQPTETVATEPEAPVKSAVATEPEAPAGGNGVAALLADADAEAGAKLSRICAACHSFDKGGRNKIGPNLWDIVGKAIAGGDYKYSRALAGLGGEWTYDNLDAFLTKPVDFAVGTKMTFGGLKKAKDRANMIAFLRGRSDDPKPLP